MPKDEATFDLDIAGIERLLASQLVPIVSEGARILRDAWKGKIQLQEEPSDPGEPPASPTRKYYNSVQSTSARVYSDAVVAYAFSPAEWSDGDALALALDEGRDRIRPRPHLDAAIEAARREIDALVARTEATLGEGS
jgi:hypothetical protein